MSQSHVSGSAACLPRLSEPHEQPFYGGGSEGYTDYPALIGTGGGCREQHAFSERYGAQAHSARALTFRPGTVKASAI